MKSFELEQPQDETAFTDDYMVCNLAIARSDPERAMTWSWDRVYFPSKKDQCCVLCAVGDFLHPMLQYRSW